MLVAVLTREGLRRILALIGTLCFLLSRGIAIAHYWNEETVHQSHTVMGLLN
jgi:hypothetical protein